MNILRVTLFQGSQESFKHALETAGITYSDVHLFTNRPMNSGSIISVFSAISDAMPWTSVANVVVAWINARSSREIIVTSQDNRVLHAKGYSADEVEKMLKGSLNVTVIDTKSTDVT